MHQWLPSQKPQGQLGGFGHHCLGIGWLKGEFYLDIINACKRADAGLCLAGQELCGWAAGGGEGHENVDIVHRIDRDFINQPQFINIHRNLGVVHLLEGLDDLGFADGGFFTHSFGR